MYDKDEVLRQVQAAIGHIPRIEQQRGSLALSFVDGTVTVAGEVSNIAAKKLALKAVAGVHGVNAVTDQLRVDAGPPTGDGATRDSVCRRLLRDTNFRNCGIAARVKGRREILRDGGKDASGVIEVAVSDGVVSLDGQVISLSHKRLAGALAWWAGGCRDVVNLLEVAPAEEDNDDEIVDALQLVLEADPYVNPDRIGIASHDRVVTMEGVVSSAGEKMRAENDAWCLFAVDSVINRLEVR